jgi:FtsP/CotA-like multicopper oxidase with cupredoxin domain
MAGVVKDTVQMPRQQSVEVDFVANDPGLTLLHCHQQDHMDEGFMMLMEYV